jgi:hypothetical protein
MAVLLIGPIQARAQTPLSSPVHAASAPDSAEMLLAGRWTYQSYRNDPILIGDDANKALAQIFAEAVVTFETPSSTKLKGAIDWTGGGLDLQGTVHPSADGSSPIVEIVGMGRVGTSTAG